MKQYSDHMDNTPKMEFILIYFELEKKNSNNKSSVFTDNKKVISHNKVKPFDFEGSKAMKLQKYRYSSPIS